jgi:hypothetical protein
VVTGPPGVGAGGGHDLEPADHVVANAVLTVPDLRARD